MQPDLMRFRCLRFADSVSVLPYQKKLIAAPVAAAVSAFALCRFLFCSHDAPIESVVSVYPCRHGYNAAFFISCFCHFDLCRLLSSANRASDSLFFDLGPVWNLLFFRTGEHSRDGGDRAGPAFGHHICRVSDPAGTSSV